MPAKETVACDNDFREWVHLLDKERDFFFLRCIERGTVWGSGRLTEKYSVPTTVDCADDWKSFIAPEDVSTLEAANSRALKLGGRHSFAITLLSRDNETEEYDAACEAFRCKGCGAIIKVFVPVVFVPAASAVSLA